MIRSLGYDDVALVPQYFNGVSRAGINTSAALGKFSFALPVVPANMKCVIDMHVAKTLQKHNYFYVMHRFDNDVIQMLEQMKDEHWNFSSISVGVKNSDYSAIKTLAAKHIEPDFITIDIAHGHCKLMRYMINHIKMRLPKTFIIAGNVATPQGYNDLVKWGAHAVKVGVGPGKSCITRLKTGFYSPMFSTVSDIHTSADRSKMVPIIADGGVQHNGDIAKAIVAGATMVMAGSVFAQCTDSPAPSVDGSSAKMYFGSASAHNKGHNNNVEGKLVTLQSNGMTLLEKMHEIKQDLQSAYSYAGGELNSSTQWICV